MQVDRAIAERWAERLNVRYPTTDAWETAKLHTLGGELQKRFVHEPGQMPMTTDWWVALQVEDAPGDRVAVEDKGVEWDELRNVRRAMSSDEATKWLETLPLASP